MSKTVTGFCSVPVSGQSCSGKSTLCEVLSSKLSWKHVDIGGEFRTLANQYQLEIERFGSIPDKQLKEIDVRIEQRILEEKHTIWDGRLSCYLSRDFENILKICCIAPMDIRSKRLSEREKISLENAERKIRKRDAEEEESFQEALRFFESLQARMGELKN